MVPDAPLVARFAADLGALAPPGSRLGLAVSGGPDSVALLLLAAAARPGDVEAATVDHALRPESRAEADLVAAACAKLGVPHTILTVEWPDPPATALQERARDARYALLGRWRAERGLDAIVTAHHLDDQAETVMMRLNRGSGVRGLAGMRATAPLPDGDGTPLLRPLLGWRRRELAEVCAKAGVGPTADPSNEDERYERVQMRNQLAAAPWIDPVALARSAANLAAADEALGWAVEQVWTRSVVPGAQSIEIAAADLPAEIQRRIVARAVGQLASEGDGSGLRGGELDRLVAALCAGGTATLRGVRCSGGPNWRFEPASPRRL